MLPFSSSRGHRSDTESGKTGEYRVSRPQIGKVGGGTRTENREQTELEEEGFLSLLFFSLLMSKKKKEAFFSVFDWKGWGVGTNEQGAARRNSIPEGRRTISKATLKKPVISCLPSIFFPVAHYTLSLSSQLGIGNLESPPETRKQEERAEGKSSLRKRTGKVCHRKNGDVVKASVHNA